MASYSKVVTGLTGLNVAKNPTHTLGVLYRYDYLRTYRARRGAGYIYVFFSKNLRALAKMPVDYPYRKHTESLINERVAAMKESSTIEEAEKRIGMGQIEEVIIQAENELMLARNILEWKAWEPLSEQAPANQWKWPL